MTTVDAPTLHQWKRLYQLAGELASLAPWNWMEETDLFAVEDPEEKYLGFVSVMGQIGQHFALAVYLGSRGLYAFWEMQYAGPSWEPEHLLEVPQIQVSFESREDLEEEDRQIMNQLGLQYQGAHGWPLFRSFRPGYLPWFLESEEAQYLTIVLEQTLEVTPRFREDPGLLASRGDTTYLVRTPRSGKKSPEWEDRRSVIVPPEPISIEYSLDMQEVETLRTLPRDPEPLEVDFFMTPSVIQEENTRPLLPYLFLLVNSGSESVIGAELFTASPTLEDMWQMLPGNFVRQLLEQGVCPGQVRLRSDLMMDLLGPLAAQLDIELVTSDMLPALDNVKAFLLQNFRAGE